MAAEILIVLLIAGYTVFAARKKYRDFKKGKGCGCSDCSGCCAHGKKCGR